MKGQNFEIKDTKRLPQSGPFLLLELEHSQCFTIC